MLIESQACFKVLMQLPKMQLALVLWSVAVGCWLCGGLLSVWRRRRRLRCRLVDLCVAALELRSMNQVSPKVRVPAQRRRWLGASVRWCVQTMSTAVSPCLFLAKHMSDGEINKVGAGWRLAGCWDV